LVPALPLLGDKGDKPGEEQVALLDDANTVQAEFRVGAGGKIGIEFKFTDGKTQTLLGVVKADRMKRTVVKDGKKVAVGTPDATPPATSRKHCMSSRSWHARLLCLVLPKVKWIRLMKVRRMAMASTRRGTIMKKANLRALLTSFLFGGLALMPAISPVPNGAAAVTAPVEVADYPKHIRLFFDEHCIDCHGKNTAKAGLRLDALAPSSPPSLRPVCGRRYWTGWRPATCPRKSGHVHHRRMGNVSRAGSVTTCSRPSPGPGRPLGSCHCDA